jgi:ATP/maltotriose-dependent transcriptional regulator MalT
MILNRGLFVTQVAGGFVYHRLFRSFLQAQLRRKNPELYIALHGKAGDWYRNQDDVQPNEAPK